MDYIQYMKPGRKFWALPNGQEDVSWSGFWSNWEQAIAKAKDQIIDKWENLKQDYKDAADPIAASERKQAESIEATRAKQASMKFISDNRTDYEKKRDIKNLELKEFEQKEQQNKDATDAVMWTLTGPVYAVQHLASPNGLVKTVGNTRAAVQNGGGPYIEKAVASAAGDVLDATILAAPLFTPEARLARAMNKNIKQGIQSGQYYHGSPNRNISRFKIGKDGGIYFTQNRNAAKQYTGTFGTGKVYNANLNLGDRVVTIDNNGRAWTQIPENVVAEAFGISPEQVHSIIGSYNLGETPWHYGLTKLFGYTPKTNYYAIDQVVRLGKDRGISSLVIKNTRDNGKRLFSKTLPYDQTVVFDPKQIILNPGSNTPMQQYGQFIRTEQGPVELIYTTKPRAQYVKRLKTQHAVQDNSVDPPIIYRHNADMKTKDYQKALSEKVVDNPEILGFQILPIKSSKVLPRKHINISQQIDYPLPIGSHMNPLQPTEKVVDIIRGGKWFDNKRRYLSPDDQQYHWIQQLIDRNYTLLHKSGGTIKIKKKNIGSFTRYCKGKVTEECIRKGKNSSNPTTRKRANFAWVARHKFKHEEGGKLNYLNYFN